ncbi:alpha/beta hydrolase [bacterium]|nr:MAG: alpha/beta hydrolase [bacterium]
MPPMPMGKPDPQMKAVLQSLKELGTKPIHTLDYKQARVQPGPPDAVKRTLEKMGKPTTPEVVDSVRDVKVDTPKGAVTVRLYRPAGSGTKKLPVLVYFHGGGFVIASVTAYDSSCRALANASGALVAAVGYSLAPEHKLPIAHEQCYAVTQAMLNGAEKYGGDSSKVAVGGESAGGNLTVDMCLMAKMRGGKMPVYQLMVYPFVNGKTIYPSHKKFVKQAPLGTPDIPWFLKYAVPNKKVGNSALGQPLYAPDSMLKGLPPATIVAAELDPLMSEGLMFAKKLEKNGVKVRYKLYPGVTHEFFGMGAVVDKAKDAVKFGADGLKMSFGMGEM